MSATIMMRQNHAAGSRRRGFLDTHPCSSFVLLYHHDSRVARMPHTWNEMDEVDIGWDKIINYNAEWYRIDTSKIAIKFQPFDTYRYLPNVAQHCKARRRRLRECQGQDSPRFASIAAFSISNTSAMHDLVSQANVFGVASTPCVTVQATHVAVVRSHLSWSHLLFPAA
ncbi:hypothetical protein G5I_00694 [Acromyrmex echinatior]|uniref:Uncharacterized protein n=1 Tax=Acromyrmex echinatior TaxID=103372 RepID=F4W5J7_ACREC|nr:hypothetical protein G5I_00694 [Acromyrmex echinatior]